MGIYDKVDSENKKIIIKFGEIIYTHLKLHEKNDSEIKDFFTNDYDIRKKIDQAFESGKKLNSVELNSYKTSYQQLQNEQYQKENQLRNLYEKKIENLQNEYQKGFEQGKQYNSIALSEKQIQLDLANKLIEEYKPKQYENMKEKGDFVENIISDTLVRKIDRNSYVFDTSDIKGSGDRIVVFPNYKMMIECKNKTSIKKSDIEQFKDHYVNDFKNNKYDVSVFISYNCEHILGKGCFKIEKHDNNIVGYLGINKNSSDKSKENIVEYFLCFVNDIYNSNFSSDKSSDDVREIVVKSILEINNDILTIEKYELPLIENIREKYENKKFKLNKLISEFNLYNIPIPLEIQKSECTENIFIDKITEKMNDDYCINKQNWKKQIISDLNLDEFYCNFLNKRGITRDKILKSFNETKNKNITF